MERKTLHDRNGDEKQNEGTGTALRHQARRAQQKSSNPIEGDCSVVEKVLQVSNRVGVRIAKNFSLKFHLEQLKGKFLFQ